MDGAVGCSGLENDDEHAQEVLFLRAKIIEAVREGDTVEMKYLMRLSIAKKLLGAFDKSSRWSLLHFSCSRGYLDITWMLLEAGANPLNAIDKYGKNCLHVAIEHHRQDIVQLLLERYPVGDWPRESKFTLGETAARSGRPHVTLLLLRNGLNPNERGKRGETPLHHAARQGHQGVVELLLQYGAEVDARETWAGRTPLHYACQAGSLKAAIALIAGGGADAHLPDLSVSGHTPLEAAVVSGHRGLSHHLVLVVDKRRRVEEKRQVAMEELAAATKETTLFEAKMARHRLAALSGKVAAKRSLVRMEKHELMDTLRGKMSRAKARLRNLQSQHERLETRANKICDSRPGSCSAVLQGRRPSTCPTSITARGVQGDAHSRVVTLGSSQTKFSGVAEGRVGERVGRQGMDRTRPAAAHIAWGVGP